MPTSNTYIVDLRDIVRSLVTELGDPDEIWLFGSRAQETGSKRSDVDILVVDTRMRYNINKLLKWRNESNDRQPLDIFLSRDGCHADSVVNGSALKHESGLASLLGARLLWRFGELVDDVEAPWIQEFIKGITYAMTVVPTDFLTTLRQLPVELSAMGLPNTLLGIDWGAIAISCADIAERLVDAVGRMGRRAPNIHPGTIRIENEYDAQNLLFLAIRPWLTDLELQPFVVRYAGQSKSADLAAAKSALVFEVKYVSNASEAAAVTKQLAGLSDIYQLNPGIKALLFIIIVKSYKKWDKCKIDSDHTDISKNPVIVTRTIFI